MKGDSDAALTLPPNLSLGEWLTDMLRGRLASGYYRPGEWIREAELRLDFGVSNGPVREALQNLVSIGALVREPHRGVRVVDLTDREIVDLFQIRLAILEFAAETTARTATLKDVAKARPLAETIIRSSEDAALEPMVAAGGALVDWVCETSRNRQLFEAWKSLTLRTRIYNFAALKACTDLRGVCKLWCLLLQTIEEGDVKRARATVREMVRRTIEDLGLDCGF